MDGTGHERDDLGDRRTYYGFEQEPSTGAGAHGDNGGADPLPLRRPAAARGADETDGGRYRTGGYPQYSAPPADQSPFDQSPFDRPYDPAGYGQSGYGQSAYGQPSYGPPDQDGDGFGVFSPARTELEPTRTRSSRHAADDTDEEEPGRRKRGDHPRHSMPLWQELPLLLVVAFCLAVLIRTFLVQAFYIPSGSMEQTLLVGDRVLVNKIVYDVRQPARGEVIVFSGTDSWAPENFAEPAGGLLARIGRTLGDLVGVSRPGEKDFIKRVIGLPGDRVSCCDPDGRIYVNGKGVDEPYVLNNSPEDVPPDPRVCRSRRFDEVLVPPGQLFVMGDHRIVSQDSRCQGTVPIENVIGRAFVIVWPSGRWDTLGVPETFDSVPGPVALAAVPLAAPTAPGESVPAGAGAAAITLPIVASLVVTARTERKRPWRPRTLPR